MFACILIVVALLALISKNAFGQSTVTIFAGTGTAGNSGDNGPSTSAKIGQVTGTWVDSNAVTFFADNSASVVRRVGTDGIITTIGGNGTTSISNSGGAFTSVALSNPWGIVGDSSFLYISDDYHIWKYQRSSGIVSILAGDGTQGTAGNGGPATSAQVKQPRGLWLNSDNSLYFAEYGNYLVRKINLSTNIISTVAGGGGFGNGGDGGPAASTNTMLTFTNGVYIDTNGVIFITSSKIRYIVNGIINTYAGGGPSSNAADGFVGTNAYFNSIFDVKGDTMGNIFVLENSRARKVDYSTKAVTTYLSGFFNARSIWLDSGNGWMIGMSRFVKTTFVNPFTTVSPTTAPTVLQSNTPTATPTFVATVAPTFTSSEIPTAIPTALTTVFPTETPSASTTPTIAPTTAPTVLQSNTPTATPTFVATVAPTFTSSEIPTAIPTALTTVFPTETPSASTTPTTTQSQVPTANPTTSPTSPRQPSSRPSGLPTLSPTTSAFRPTGAPSFSPTVGNPVPSETPTHVPTSNPTTVPSLVPNANPTFTPSTLPSCEPSSRPSGQPTLSPTAPTFTPTAVPSCSPTVKNDDVVKVSGMSRVKFVNGETLNKVSLATLVSAFQNISENAQSTEITSTVLVVESSPQSVRREIVTSMSVSGQASYIYDIGFLSTYVMTYHAGYTSSELAAQKTAKVRQAIEVGEFESVLRSLAQAQNATQLLNGSCSEVRSLESVVVVSSSTSSSDSKDEDSLSTETVAGIVIGILGGCLVLGIVLYVILKRYDDEKKREEMSVERKSSEHITAL